jgi:predicted MPP superfamily phosphohydrolase
MQPETDATSIHGIEGDCPEPCSERRAQLTRRRFLKASLSFAAAGIALGPLYAWQVEPHWLEVVTRPLRVSGLPGSLSGARLVQLSDIHVGPRVSDRYVLDVFRRVAALRPDIVAVTGDFTSFHPDVAAHVDDVYRGLPHGRLATVGILGNHDYGRNWSDEKTAERVTVALHRLGVHVLRNEVVDVAGLKIVGMDDLWAKRFRPQRALATLDEGQPTLALSHNPDSVDLPGWDRFQGWILAGHTHGGQCKPPFLTPPLLPIRNRRYTAGEFALPGSRRMYISRGIGHLIQVRFNVRPEVTVFELRRT